jgi:hypothetical protein
MCGGFVFGRTSQIASRKILRERLNWTSFAHDFWLARKTLT